MNQIDKASTFLEKHIELFGDTMDETLKESLLVAIHMMNNRSAEQYRIKADCTGVPDNEAGSNNECEYCVTNGCCPPLDWKYGLDHMLPDYEFCPMCGRKVLKK